jgi:hypothetical protein
MAVRKNDVSWWWGVVISGLLLVMVLTLYYYVKYLKPGELSPEIVLSALLVIGVIALIVALSFTAVIFKSLGLADKTQSLGLPEGSVRAVIALSLILIFMMSSIFLYWQVEEKEGSIPYISIGVTQEQINKMPQEEIVSIVRSGTTKDGEMVFNVTRLVKDSNKTSEDIAKQIITTVSTLVVAVAGFYFGTKAVSVAKGGPPVSDPVIRRIEPTELKQGEETEFKVFGKNFELAKEVKLIRDSNVRPCTDVTSSSTMITCKLQIDEKDPVGTWTVVVINSDDGEDRLEDAFTIREK